MSRHPYPPALSAGTLHLTNAWWAAAGLAIALAGTWAAWKFGLAAHSKPRLTYEIAGTPLLQAPRSIQARLEIRHLGTHLTDPHLMRIVLTCHGRRDIPSSSFDQDQPVTVDLGVPILDVLDSHSHPVGAQEPRAAATGTTLRIGPGRIRAGAHITYHVLTNGPCSPTWRDPLIDVTVTQATSNRLATRIGARRTPPPA
ncbi:hypothetical protein ACFH04_07935 [Streptomyces noboritoensis]|uniref:Uncharacterized protein n=1 Tax=Streptomyces noboritoensis TaxID=67337 RepID=A0ABV6TCY5_9ACTN